MKKCLFVCVVMSMFLSGCASFGSGKGAHVVDVNAASDSVHNGVKVGNLSATTDFSQVRNRSSGTSSSFVTTDAPHNQIYHFSFNKSVVDSTFFPSLQAQANYLIAHPSVKIRLAGFTDNIGSREYNVALGWRRAVAVAAQLQQYGVSKRQLILLSYGQEKPVSLGESTQDRALNRRVELRYIPKSLEDAGL